MALRHRRLLLVALGLATAAILAAAFGLHVLRRAASPAAVQARLSELLGLEVHVDAVAIAWLPPSVVVRDVAALPAISIGRARIDPSLEALLARRLEVGELHLEDATLALVQRADAPLALDTGAPDGVALPASDGAGAGLDALPDLHLRRAVVIVRHAAGDRDPLRLRIEALDFDDRPLLGARLRARVALGEAARLGRLDLRARASGLAGLGGDPQDDPSLHLSLRGRELALLALGAWLPGSLPVRAGPGPVDLDLELDGRRSDGFEATLALAKGSVTLGAFALDAPARAEGRVAEAPEGLRIEDGTLEAARVTTSWLRSGPVRAEFGWSGKALSVGSLHVEDMRPGPGDARGASAFGLDLHVQRARSLGVEGLAFGSSAATMPTRVEARGIEATLERETEDPGVPGLPLSVSRLVVADLAPGRTATLELDAEGPDAGRLRVRGRYGPWNPDAPPREQPLALDVRFEAVRAARLAALLPAAWRTAADTTTSLDASLELEGPRLGALTGPIAADVRAGSLRVANLALGAPVRVEGRLRPGGAGTDAALLEARVRAAGALFETSRGGETSATLRLRDGRLEIVRLEIEDLEAGAGRPLRLGSDDGGSIAMQRAAHLAIQGLAFGDGGFAPSLPDAVDVRDGAVDVKLGLRSDAPPLSLSVKTLEARRLGAGDGATLRLEGSIARADGAAVLRGRATLAPFAPDAALLPQVRELVVSLEDAEIAELGAQLPHGVAPTAASGRLDASLDLEPAASGGVAGLARLHVRDGSVEIGGLRLPDPQLEAELTISPAGVPRVRDVTVLAAGGTWRQVGSLELSDPPSIDARLGIEDVALYEIVDASALGRGDRPPVSPRLDATLDLAGPLGRAGARLAAVRGEGLLTLAGGELPSSELLVAVGRSLARQVGVTPRDGAGRPTPLERASIPLRLEAGRMHSDDLVVSTREYLLRGNGYVTLEGDLHLETRVSFRPSGVTRLLGVLDVTRPLTGDLLKLPPVTVGIRGTLAEPRFVPEPSRLPVAWARSLLGLPGGVVDRVTAAAQKLGEQLGQMLPGWSEAGEDAAAGAPEAPTAGDAASDGATSSDPASDDAASGDAAASD